MYGHERGTAIPERAGCTGGRIRYYRIKNSQVVLTSLAMPNLVTQPDVQSQIRRTL